MRREGRASGYLESLCEVVDVFDQVLDALPHL